MSDIIKTSTYDIHIGSGILSGIGDLIMTIPGNKYRRVAVITDETVEEFYGEAVVSALDDAGYDVCIFAFEAGEQSKTIRTLDRIFGFLSKNSIARSDLIVALGGGVVGDMAGFAAASWLRGVDFVNVPTTLLAQTDSSIGGKTGVNIKAGKNLVGAFYNPRLVVTDTDTLGTLTDAALSDGLGEVVKYGMIRSAVLFELVSADLEQVKTKFPDIVRTCAKIKVGVVESDFRESGERKIFNFGHTFGHAIEKYYNFSKITHGRAVAAGMSFIAGLSDYADNTNTKSRLDGCLKTLGLPVTEYVNGICRILERDKVFGEVDVNVLLEYCGNDKKRSGDGIDILICPQIGECEIRRLGKREFVRFVQSAKPVPPAGNHIAAEVLARR